MILGITELDVGTYLPTCVFTIFWVKNHQYLNRKGKLYGLQQHVSNLEFN